MTKEAARKVKTAEASPRRRPRADASRSDSRLRAIPREAIAERAYFLFLERGGEHGHDVADWLQAESELAGGRSGNGKNH
jgi:hypothetical protein